MIRNTGLIAGLLVACVVCTSLLVACVVYLSLLVQGLLTVALLFGAIALAVVAALRPAGRAVSTQGANGSRS